MDQCIYQKVNESKIYFLVLYVDDILLATNDKGLLHEVKQFLSKTFWYEGYVWGILYYWH
jgi:hypothetical protein